MTVVKLKKIETWAKQHSKAVMLGGAAAAVAALAWYRRSTSQSGPVDTAAAIRPGYVDTQNVTGPVPATGSQSFGQFADAINQLADQQQQQSADLAGQLAGQLAGIADQQQQSSAQLSTSITDFMKNNASQQRVTEPMPPAAPRPSAKTPRYKLGDTIDVGQKHKVIVKAVSTGQPIYFWDNGAPLFGEEVASYGLPPMGNL